MIFYIRGSIEANFPGVYGLQCWLIKSYWYCKCKSNKEFGDQLLLHCSVARDVVKCVYSLWGFWVTTKIVFRFSCMNAGKENSISIEN